MLYAKPKKQWDTYVNQKNANIVFNFTNVWRIVRPQIVMKYCKTLATTMCSAVIPAND